MPPKAGEAAPPVHFDGSVWLLLLVNVAVLCVAERRHWPVTQLMLMYWAQSVAIGVAYFLRIRALEHFSTANFKIDNQPVQPTPETKAQVLFGFVLIYGFCHAIYFVFISAGATMVVKAPLRLDFWFWLCVLAFALNHWWSYRYNRELDRRGTPNIGTLSFLPLARVFPMHVMIATGAFVASTVLPFGVLKIMADVGMHLVERAQLREDRPEADPPKSE